MAAQIVVDAEIVIAPRCFQVGDWVRVRGSPFGDDKIYTIVTIHSSEMVIVRTVQVPGNVSCSMLTILEKLIHA